MRKAAHMMVSYLAGNLALVTCKEPLRSNMVTHVRHLLNEQGYTEVRTTLLPLFSTVFLCGWVRLQQVVPEHAIMLIVNDNVDVACRAIEKAASDRAISDVDDHFALAYSDRRLHREVGLERSIFLGAVY